jgi:hypothetical protein
MRRESGYLERDGKVIVPTPRRVAVGNRGVAARSNGSHMWVT